MSAALTALRSGVRWPGRAPAGVIGVLLVCVAAAGIGLRHVDRRSDAVADQIDSNLRVSTVVSAAGVSDCHPLANRPPLKLDGYTFWATTALPVVIDRQLRVWGPRCVVSSGLAVADGWVSGSSGWPSDIPKWSPPAWAEFNAGPGSSELLDLPGLSDCAVGSQPTASTSQTNAEPFVVVLDESGQVWGPRCVVSSGVAAS